MRRDRRPRPDGGEPTDERLDDLLAALASALRATEELPVSPSASVWLGEAHAVAEDLARSDADRPVVRERVGHVRRLLTSADDLDNDEAAARVSEALDLAESILDRTRDVND